MKYAFISYSRADSGAVDGVQAALESAGIRVWRDVQQIGPGDDWKSVIREAISGEALAFLACFSFATLALVRSRQNEELSVAVGELRQRWPHVPWLIPVRLDDCEVPDLDLGGGRTLASLEPADLFGAGRADALSRLVEAVSRILGPGQATVASRIPASARRIVVGDIPQQSTAYQDRPGLLDALTGGTPVGARVVFAVTGLRGTGKTQVAAALARRRLAEGWPVVAWVDASSQASLLAGYGELAAAAGLAGDGPDSPVAAGRVRRWLEADGQRCLVVLDNAVSADVVRPFLPAAGAAQVVVTSSRASLAALGAPVPVGVFSEGEAAAFLAERTGLEDDAGALAVARELGCLPLALTQAGAVIAGQRLGYAAYLRRLAGVMVDAYLARPEEDPYPHRTAEAIMLAVRAALAGDATGTGARILDVLAVLSAAGVPRSVLAAAAGADEVMADGILGHLAGWSLVLFSADGRTVLAHRLVLRVLREHAAAAGTLATAVADAMAVLGGMLPAGEDTWRHPEVMREFVTQVTALAGHLDGPGVPDGPAQVTFLDLLARAGWYLNQLSDITRSVPLLERVLADRERMLSADHPDTLQSLNSLASAYRSAGRLSEAIPLFEHALTDRDRVLGADHPDTLTSRRNLAGAYLSAGRLSKAIPLFEQALADRERVLGADHPDTLQSLNSLASAYRSAGRLSEATPLFEQALTDRDRVLGADHPDTLTSRNDLAGAYRAEGRLDEAIGLYQQNLADRERVLGADHPDTLISWGNLAGAYRAAGRLDEAVGLYQQNLADRERVLGTDHPSTLQSRNNLARAYRAGGQLDEAIALYHQNLADRERVLGADHPHTLSSRSNLAAAYKDGGRLGEAISLFEENLANRERVQGADHPDTLELRNNLAAAYQAAGRLGEAVTLFQQALADAKRVLRDDHPLTQEIRGNYARARDQATQC